MTLTGEAQEPLDILAGETSVSINAVVDAVIDGGGEIVRRVLRQQPPVDSVLQITIQRDLQACVWTWLEHSKEMDTPRAVQAVVDSAGFHGGPNCLLKILEHGARVCSTGSFAQVLADAIAQAVAKRSRYIVTALAQENAMTAEFFLLNTKLCLRQAIKTGDEDVVSALFETAASAMEVEDLLKVLEDSVGELIYAEEPKLAEFAFRSAKTKIQPELLLQLFRNTLIQSVARNAGRDSTIRGLLPIAKTFLPQDALTPILYTALEQAMMVKSNTALGYLLESAAKHLPWSIFAPLPQKTLELALIGGSLAAVERVLISGASVTEHVIQRAAEKLSKVVDEESQILDSLASTQRSQRHVSLYHDQAERQAEFYYSAYS
ncbi:hypothetical protein Slin15195_G073900 [Septoria linicola]|uniref:Uncharacterized protein n=1 Tax=Septoria linicola TaxID=215465 RepID=A0A9Q9B0I6_9PEZI|nr:hypothetical protein Slin15195_G073900 [Septoria linicola]